VISRFCSAAHPGAVPQVAMALDLYLKAATVGQTFGASDGGGRVLGASVFSGRRGDPTRVRHGKMAADLAQRSQGARRLAEDGRRGLS
jgi:hypothetical protein